MNFDSISKIISKCILPNVTFVKASNLELILRTKTFEDQFVGGWKVAKKNLRFLFPECKVDMLENAIMEIHTGMILEHTGHMMPIKREN